MPDETRAAVPGEVWAWRTPVSLEAETVAAMLAEGLARLSYRFSQKRGERSFGETISVDPHAQGTPAWRFFIDQPAAFTMEIYMTRPRPKSTLTFMEVVSPSADAEPAVRRVLRWMADEAPWPPWRFSYDLRMRIGPLNPAFREARRQWKPVLADEPLAGAEA